VGCSAGQARTTSRVNGAGIQAPTVATPNSTESAMPGTEPATAPPPSSEPATAPQPRTPPPSTPPPSSEPATASQALAGTATRSRVDVHATPDGPVSRSFDNPQASGAPLTFSVDRQEGQWLRVSLPARPNGSTGWVSASDVTVTQVPYRIEISAEGHQLRLYKSGELLYTFPAATGTGGTPTPRGRFYLTELLAPTNSGYGPYAYGLSGFSEVLNDFGGGPGQIGLHGTDDTGSIGQSVSHGCIRLSNANITTLANMLPLGTPVLIS